jgi:predicted enzyme related to lactoylglutathione lyase
MAWSSVTGRRARAGEPFTLVRRRLLASERPAPISTGKRLTAGVVKPDAPGMGLLLNIDVPDLEAAERFYSAAFGLTVGRRFGGDFVELLGWPAAVYLLRRDAGTIGAGAGPRRYERHWTPIHPDIVVEDLEAAVMRAVTAGAVVEQPSRDAEYGRIAMLSDPFGHGFCLIQFNAEGYDALL